MIDWWQTAVLALVQGLTEFLPVSSSAHLILSAQLLGWQDQGLAFDVAVHVGSLLAVLVYFRSDLAELSLGSFQELRDGNPDKHLFMVLCLLVATIPAGLAGILAKDWVASELRSLHVIAATTIGFGLLLGWADRRGGGRQSLTLRGAIWIGLAQALAIVPGTSRSGVTMTMALMCGLGRSESARFSFLLSIPIIAAAGLLEVIEMVSSGSAVNWGGLLVAAGLSGVAAFACIGWFIGLIERVGFLPFVIYRVLLGLVLLGVILWY